MWHVKRRGVVLFGKVMPAVLLALAVAVTAGCGASSPASATAVPVGSASDEPSVILTVAVPTFMVSNFTDELIHEFESSHAGVKVSLVKVDASIPPAAAGLDKHLAAVQQYAGEADVLYV